MLSPVTSVGQDTARPATQQQDVQQTARGTVAAMSASQSVAPETANPVFPVPPSEKSVLSRMVLQDKHLDAEARLDQPAGPTPSFDISLLEQREAETEYAARLSDVKYAGTAGGDAPLLTQTDGEVQAQTPQTQRLRDSVGDQNAKATEAYTSSLPVALKGDFNIKI